MSRLADRVRRRVVGVLVGALASVGVGVGLVLHLRAVEGLDRALVAAAEAHAVPHPEPDPLMVAGGTRSIAVLLLQGGEPHPAAAWISEARSTDGALLRAAGGQRFALVDTAQLGMPAEHGGPVAVAWAPEVTLRASVGGFVVVYALASVVVGGAVMALLGPILRDALMPLERAAAAVDRVVAMASGQRVGSDGPAEIAVLLRSVDELLDRLDVAFAGQARFTAYAAHELRTPLAALLGEVELALRRDRDAGSYREALERVEGAARELAALVDGLVVLTRLDAGHVEQDRGREHASAIVHAACGREAGALARAGVRLEIEVRSDAEVTAHVPLVELALANVLRNVARHAPGARARVVVERRAGEVVFRVVDDGPGIDPGRQEAVFDRYRRQPGPTSGLGLGLSLAREIARRHGGDARCLPSESGATIELTIRA